MVLMDALSQMPNPRRNSPVELDVRFDGISTDDIDQLIFDLINLSPQLQEKLL